MPPEAWRTRFAPSPTGPLHLGHAYSALTAHARAQEHGGTFLLRIEDIDTPRCRPEFDAAILADLRWLGLRWPEPVMRQSERMAHYRDALDRLVRQGVCYPCRCTRAEIRAALSAPQEGGAPAPVYPGTCRNRSMSDAGPRDAIRLDMRRALDRLAGRLPRWRENGPLHRGDHAIAPERLIADIGDVVLARRDIATSYHIAVVTDDAAQGITEVVRGDDLFAVTPLHCLLQALLEHPTPGYYHHALILDERGNRLAKRDDARAISAYREAGDSPDDLRRRVGLSPRAS